MTSRPCPPTTFSLVGAWISSALWHRSGKSIYPKTPPANLRPNNTDVPTLPNPPSTRPQSLARTLPNPALAPPTLWTRVQATQRSANRPSRLRLPLHILTIQPKTPVPATTATTNSLPWTRCQCSNKHSGSHSPSKACQTRNWPICSLPDYRRLTRSATWTVRRSSSGNNSTTACTRRRCSNISRTSSSRAASSSSNSNINNSRHP